jgi:hypothetical protein
MYVCMCVCVCVCVCVCFESGCGEGGPGGIFLQGGSSVKEAGAVHMHLKMVLCSQRPDCIHIRCRQHPPATPVVCVL